MRTRMFQISSGMTLAMVVAACTAVLVAQAPSGGRVNDPTPEAAIKASAEAAKAAAALKDWRPSRTPWGDPDLRGVWLLATYTPLQRPRELADKPFYTEAEAMAAFKRAAEVDSTVDTGTVHYDWKEFGMEAWQGGARPNLRTSLIVDPADGRQPPVTAEAEQRLAAATAARRLRDPAAGVRTLNNMATRCILGIYPTPLLRGGNPGADSAATAAGVTAEAQFFQSPGYMTIVNQSNNDLRIIPLDGRPHLPSHVRRWLGDSRGRWEGNTLVVETTNFKPRPPANQGPFFHGSSDAMQLVERFTRTGPNTMQYTYTVTDPKTYTRPWTVEAPLPRVDGPIYEFACHEQNYGLINVVIGTQISEGSRKPSR